MKHKTDWVNEIVYHLSRPYILTLALIFLFIPSVKLTQALESGAEFLKIGADAKAAAMGSAYTAVASGADAVYYNPAGLAALQNPEFAFSHTSWLLGSRHDFIGIAMPMGKKSEVRSQKSEVGSRKAVMGIGFIRLTNSSMEARGADRSSGGGFDAYDQSISLAFAGRGGNYNIGIGGKYIESSIGRTKAAAFAVDLGVNRRLKGLPVSLGLAVQNLGTPMKYIAQKDPLPLSVSAGLMVGIIPGFNAAIDLKRMMYDKSHNFSVGSDYAVMPGFSLRAGYMTTGAALSSRQAGFSGGVGMSLFKTQVDYSITPFGELGNAHKISLKRKF